MSRNNTQTRELKKKKEWETCRPEISTELSQAWPMGPKVTTKLQKIPCERVPGRT